MIPLDDSLRAPRSPACQYPGSTNVGPVDAPPAGGLHDAHYRRYRAEQLQRCDADYRRWRDEKLRQTQRPQRPGEHAPPWASSPALPDIDAFIDWRRGRRAAHPARHDEHGSTLSIGPD